MEIPRLSSWISVSLLVAGINLPAATVSVTPESVQFRETRFFDLRATTDFFHDSAYQWFKDGVPLAGETDFTLRVFQAHALDVGIYHVEIQTAATGLLVSNAVPVSLVHRRAPVFISHPDPQVLKYGGSSSLHLDCSVEDDVGVTFQWFHNDEPEPFSNYRSHRFDSPSGDIGVDLPGRYYAEATNAYGTTRSQEITVSVDPGKAPVFTTEPSDLELRPVDRIELFAMTTTEPAASFEWFHNGEPMNLNGGNPSLDGSDPTVAGTYHAVATNRFGSAISRTATVTLRPNDPPVIIQHPADLRLIVGQTAKLRVFAVAGTVFNCTWYKNGEPIIGPNSYDLPLPTDGSAAGTYHAVLENASGTATSNPATVTLFESEPAPVIVRSPGELVGVLGQTVYPEIEFRRFPSSVRWFFEGEHLPEFDYIQAPGLLVSAERVGNYTVEVTTPAGTEVSPPIALSVRTPLPPFFSTSLTRNVQRGGFENSLRYGFIAEAPVSLQWLKNGEPIDLPTNRRPNFNTIGTNYAGTYEFVVTNGGGSTTSNALEVLELPVQVPRIVGQSSNRTRVEGGIDRYATLEVLVDGFATTALQWFRNGAPIPGATEWRLTVTVDEQPGTYTATATNSAGSTTTAPIEVTFLQARPLPHVTLPDAGLVGYFGVDLHLPAQGNGTGDLTFTWLHDGAVIAGQSGATLPLLNLTETDAGLYSVLIADDHGVVASQPVQLSLSHPTSPQFVFQPGYRRIPLGSWVQLDVQVSGDPVPTVQWFKDGEPIPGANAIEYVVESVTPDDLGIYSVTIDNGFGSVRSGVGQLELDLIDSDLAGTQRTGDRHYRPGVPFVIHNEAFHRLSADSLRWQVLLPEGWSFVSAESSAVPSSSPGAGDTDLLEWSWSPAPDAPVTFSYTLLPPAEGDAVVKLTTLVELTSGQTTTQTLAVPTPLSLTSWPRHHSADTDADGGLNLGELLRVIELYNTRAGSTRIGRYRPFAASVDGFEPDSASLAGYRYPIHRYHSADADRDGTLSLSELLRVIELYNTRNGTTRTGAYHSAPDTTDGFAPGAGE